MRKEREGRKQGTSCNLLNWPVATRGGKKKKKRVQKKKRGTVSFFSARPAPRGGGKKKEKRLKKGEEEERLFSLVIPMPVAAPTQKGGEERGRKKEREI